jgi:hypothetical protein
METGEPRIDLLQNILSVKDGMDNQLRRIGFDHLSGFAFAKDMNQICSGLQGRNGCKIRGTSVQDAAAKYTNPTALTLVHVIGQLGHDDSGFLLQEQIPRHRAIMLTIRGCHGRWCCRGRRRGYS